MLKRFVPFAHAKSIYDIDVSFYKRMHVKYVLSDLDNTLDSYRQKEPLTKAKELKKVLNNEGIELIVISNNRGKRVHHYCEQLGVNCFSSLRKPFAHRLCEALKKLSINKDETIMIGDQIVTDISCGNKAKIRTILTEKLVKED